MKNITLSSALFFTCGITISDPASGSASPVRGGCSRDVSICQGTTATWQYQLYCNSLLRSTCIVAPWSSTTQDPAVHTTEVFCRPRSAPSVAASLEHPSISSILTVGDDIIANGVSLLADYTVRGGGSSHNLFLKQVYTLRYELLCSSERAW